jgi:hypothetical protein
VSAGASAPALFHVVTVLPQFEIGSLSYVLRLLASLALRMRIFLNAIKNILMLRSARPFETPPQGGGSSG